MKPSIIFLLLSVPFTGAAQSVNSINCNYWYNQQGEVELQIQPVKHKDSIQVFYRLHTANGTSNKYLVKWEKRDSYSQRQGAVLAAADTVAATSAWTTGRFEFSKPIKPWILFVRVSNIQTGKSWYFFRQIEAHYPVNGYVVKDGEMQWSPYLSASSRYTLAGTNKPIYVSFYKDKFPTPSPPFTVKEIKMDRFLFPDSIFTTMPGEPIGPFKNEGLYLAQEDTTASEGFAFLIRQDPYPKYNKLASLKGPLLFVTTRAENDALGAAGEDKVKFDKIILDITKDKERARVFMRNYFRRVETANMFFTSFKEGWKTDRGMIYVIFGAPEFVFVDGQYEVWEYKTPKQQFYFTRAGSVYSPDHSVLVRDKDYTENWYSWIDLWRKSRF